MLELSEISYCPATASASVLRDINLQVGPGRPLLIAGASGSGKTSLLEVISGLATAQSGTVSWRGRALSHRQRRWLCGIVFQFPERHFLGLSVNQELSIAELQNIQRRSHELGQNGKDVFSFAIARDPILRFISAYKSKAAFLSDLERMIANCRAYNDPKTQYYKCANDLEAAMIRIVRLPAH